MIDPEYVSADLTALDGFVEQSTAGLPPLWELQASLAGLRATLAEMPLPLFVHDSQLGAFEQLLGFMGEKQQFVADVASVLRLHGQWLAGEVWQAQASMVAMELARSDSERLDAFEASLIVGGVDEVEAALVRAAVAKRLATNRALGFYDAVLEGTAAHRGISRDELERETRGFQLSRAETVAIVGAHFDVVAGRSGNRQQITIEDLIATAEDTHTTPVLRDAAYRLAADAGLFVDVDVAAQTDGQGPGV